MRTRAALVGSLYTVLGCGDDVATSPDGGHDDASTCPPGALTPGCACEPALYPRRVCYDGPPGTLGVGVCVQGIRSCDNGVVSACQGEVVPSSEVCNGKDDNCNGIVDDVEADAGTVGTYGTESYRCDAGGTGACAFGNPVCHGSMEVCESIVGTGVPEICNGVDDNCNGIVDENLNNIACTVTQLPDGGPVYGVCQAGHGTCVSAKVNCAPSAPKAHEICNGLDDNCNGQIDEAPTYYDGTFTTQCISCTPNANGIGAYCYFCPSVLVHDGTELRYVTTVGGASVMGQRAHVADGKPVDFEPLWCRLDHAPAGRYVRARLLAGDDEIVYVSSASLAVAFHEPGCEVFSSTAIQWNTLKRSDPLETLALRTDAMRAVVSARWMGDLDVTRELQTLDDRAVAVDPTRDNFYEIDFGAVTRSTHARLVIDGFKRKLDRGLGARGVALAPPRIEVEQADGTFALAKTISTPRGDRKAVVFHLGELTWPNGRYRMRIYTGTHEAGTALWMLDRVRLTEEEPRPLALSFHDASAAQLTFAGAPTVTNRDDVTRTLQLRDDGRGPLERAHRTFGRFTRYGDVRELLDAKDARLVVMRRGDAIDLGFATDSVPPGLARTVFLVTSLVYKPRVFFGLSSDRMTHVDPLPFPGMRRYPPAEPAPIDRRWLELQTRVYTEDDDRWGA